MSREAAIQRAILDYARLRWDMLLWRNQSGQVRVRRGFMLLAPKGSPDLVGLTRGGRFLGVECKAKDGALSEEQRDFKRRIEQLGGIYVVGRSVEDVRDALAEDGATTEVAVNPQPRSPPMNMMRIDEPGWVKIGATDSVGRRSLWLRLVWADPENWPRDPKAIAKVELCAGREGDDAFVAITRDNPQFDELLDLFLTAQYAAET